MTNMNRIGLALSGGGVRAIAFHAGAFKYLADIGYLENIRHVSTVSGGSLFTGLVFNISNNSWPTSKEYLSNVYPEIRQLLTKKSLQLRSASSLFLNPMNWRYALSRANVMAHTIESYWKVNGTLSDLPKKPVWSLNATTAETGRRFRFKGTQIGDYETGYAEATHIKLAVAMAISAAFPGGIGPFSMRSSDYEWKKKENWSSTDLPKNVKLNFKKIHLYDGGLYDNLGLEPLYDIGTQKIKSNPEVDTIIVVDAGAAYLRSEIPHPLNPKRFLRIADIAFDQARALRVRSLANFAILNPRKAYFIQIGTNATEKINLYRRDNASVVHPEGKDWLSQKEVHAAGIYRTTLRQMSETDYDLIARHGYETMSWNIQLFGVS